MMLIMLLFFHSPLRETNPAKIVFKTTINVYQKLIAPAQGDVCNFSPSCSHFAVAAVEKYGVCGGTLMAADRLLRCNPSAINHYDKFYSGITNGKIYDPVENNFIFQRIRKPFKVSLPPPE